MYTLSFDASLKVNSGNLKGFLNHVARDVDEKNGITHNHSNPNILSGLTTSNETYCNIGDGWQDCEKSEQLSEALEKRLGNVKKPLRKDAVIMRPLILQLDPQWYRTHNTRDDLAESCCDMLEWAEKKFGKDNLIGASLHLDEGHNKYSPHLHVLFCPVTDDGRLSQKDWFSSPAELRKMHDDFRQHMIDKGYEIDCERKPARKRLKEKDYRDFKALESENKKLDERERHIADMSLRASESLSNAIELRKRMEERENELNERERLLSAREANIKNREQNYDGILHNYQIMLKEFEKTKQAEKAARTKKNMDIINKTLNYAKSIENQNSYNEFEL